MRRRRYGGRRHHAEHRLRSRRAGEQPSRVVVDEPVVVTEAFAIAVDEPVVAEHLAAVSRAGRRTVAIGPSQTPSSTRSPTLSRSTAVGQRSHAAEADPSGKTSTAMRARRTRTAADPECPPPTRRAGPRRIRSRDRRPAARTRRTRSARSARGRRGRRGRGCCPGDVAVSVATAPSAWPVIAEAPAPAVVVELPSAELRRRRRRAARARRFTTVACPGRLGACAGGGGVVAGACPGGGDHAAGGRAVSCCPRQTPPRKATRNRGRAPGRRRSAKSSRPRLIAIVRVIEPAAPAVERVVVQVEARAGRSPWRRSPSPHASCPVPPGVALVRAVPTPGYAPWDVRAVVPAPPV